MFEGMLEDFGADPIICLGVQQSTRVETGVVPGPGDVAEKGRREM